MYCSSTTALIQQTRFSIRKFFLFFSLNFPVHVNSFPTNKCIIFTDFIIHSCSKVIENRFERKRIAYPNFQTSHRLWIIYFVVIIKIRYTMKAISRKKKYLFIACTHKMRREKKNEENETALKIGLE